MTNYKQPHKFEDSGETLIGKRMCECGLPEDIEAFHGPLKSEETNPTTDIEEIVKTNNDKASKLFFPSINRTPEEHKKMQSEYEDWLTQTLKDYGDAVRAEKDTEINKFKGDMAHAIGYCRGIGYPERYLEKRYPELIKSLKGNNEQNTL